MYLQIILPILTLAKCIKECTFSIFDNYFTDTTKTNIRTNSFFGLRNPHFYFQYKGNEENECGVKEMALIEFL